MLARSSDSSARSRCLSEQLLVALASGTLATDERVLADVHLDACAHCRQLLALTMLEASNHYPCQIQDVQLQVGAVVAGRYRIEQYIARGGMGEVYRAFDHELREQVALKTVRWGTDAQAEIVERLRREVKFARKVSHPHVCRIHGFGRHLPGAASGAPLHFITMQVIAGETLQARLRRAGALEPSDLLQLARQLASALAAAHTAGVLHRDLKASNIMLRESDVAKLDAVVLDFGLARCVEGEPEPLTATGKTLGTPDYMAPEQLEPDRALSPAADIYALGVVLFQAGTGCLPFRGDSPTARGLMRLYHPAPDPQSLRPAIPSFWNSVCQQCLARAPEARPSAEQLARTLDAYAQDPSRRPADTPPGPGPNPQPAALLAQKRRTTPGPKRRTSVLAIAAGFLSLALGLWWMTVSASQDQATTKGALSDHEERVPPGRVPGKGHSSTPLGSSQGFSAEARHPRGSTAFARAGDEATASNRASTRPATDERTGPSTQASAKANERPQPVAPPQAKVTQRTKRKPPPTRPALPILPERGGRSSAAAPPSHELPPPKVAQRSDLSPTPPSSSPVDATLAPSLTPPARAGSLGQSPTPDAPLSLLVDEFRPNKPERREVKRQQPRKANAASTPTKY